jgi:hypothetical protein
MSGKYNLSILTVIFPDGRSVHPYLKDGGALQISLQHFQVFHLHVVFHVLMSMEHESVEHISFCVFMLLQMYPQMHMCGCVW